MTLIYCENIYWGYYFNVGKKFDIGEVDSNNFTLNELVKNWEKCVGCK